MKAVSVIPLPRYKLQVTFDDGVSGEVDLKDILQSTVFSTLKDEQLFNQVKFNKSAIFWSEEMEIDLLNIYMELSGKNSEEILALNKSYASN